MLSDFGPRNRFNGAGIQFRRAPLEFKLPFFFVKELQFPVHELIVDLFRERGARALVDGLLRRC